MICCRLRQHNGEIAGGAKAARSGRPWRVVGTVRGFNSRSEGEYFKASLPAAASLAQSLCIHAFVR
jgi:hypothetical protein